MIQQNNFYFLCDYPILHDEIYENQAPALSLKYFLSQNNEIKLWLQYSEMYFYKFIIYLILKKRNKNLGKISSFQKCLDESLNILNQKHNIEQINLKIIEFSGFHTIFTEYFMVY